MKSRIGLLSSGLWLLMACGGDGDGGGAGADAGANDGPDGTDGTPDDETPGDGTPGDGTPSDGTEGDGTPGACDAPTAEVVLAGVNADSLEVVGDDLVFVDQDGGVQATLGMSGAIRKVKRDGSGDTVLYAAPATRNIMNLVANEQNVYFLMGEDGKGASLYSLPLEGGEPTQISAGEGAGYDDLLAYVFAVDDASAYVVDSGDPQTLRRVSLSDGAETIIAEHDGLVITNTQRLGDVIWYTPSQGIDGFHRVDADAADASTAMRVGTSSCTLRMVATEQGIYCGGALGLSKYDLTGENYEKVLDLLEVDPGPVNPSLPDGDDLYVYPVASPSEGRPLRKVSTLSGDAEIIGCDVRGVTNLTFGASDVFWVETRDDGEGEVRSIVRLAK